MIWQTVLDVIDAVESWVAGQSYWIQVILLLGVLGPLCYFLAGFIDRMVEAVLAWHSRRDQPPGSPVDTTVSTNVGAPVGTAAHSPRADR
ncbi:hypothetical protein ACVBEQ_15695 [Nakamurella sp. GG22]